MSIGFVFDRADPIVGDHFGEACDFRLHQVPFFQRAAEADFQDDGRRTLALNAHPQQSAIDIDPAGQIVHGAIGDPERAAGEQRRQEN